METGRGADAAPVFGHERARNGYRPIVLHVWMELHRPGKRAKEIVGRWIPAKIVHEPAKHGVQFHPLHKANHVGVGEMMREEGAYDDVNRLVRPVRKNIVSDPV